MEFKEIDYLFDEAFKRVGNKTPQAIDPYAQGPHSTDHYLLKKSWDYFKNRIRTIEAHWDEISKAKEEEINALKKELALVKEELGEAELKNQMLNQFEEEVRRTRSTDFVDFKKLSDRLHHAWEEERQSLATQLSAVEFALTKERERSQKIVEDKVRQIEAMVKRIDALKEEGDSRIQKNIEEKKSLESAVDLKDREVAERDLKLEKLAVEIEGKNQFLKDQEVEILSLGTKIDALLLRIKDTDETVRDRETRIKNLSADVERLEFEKDSVKKAWANEQAQWRELWDRTRELWDKR